MIAQVATPFEALAEGAPTGLVGTITVEIYDPTDAATIVAATTAGITEPRPGTYQAMLTAPVAGTFAIRWTTPSGSAEEALTVTVSPDPGLNDIRALIPRVRRALDGPSASGPEAPSATLTDDQLTALIADAIATVIFYTGGLFGHELNVTERDVTYGAPTEWTVDPPLSEAEATVIVAQAALDHFFSYVATLKVSETITDEGQEWSYSISSTLLAERIKQLTRARDVALDQVAAAHPVPTAFISFLHERDRRTAELVEPFYPAGLLNE